MSNEKAPIPEDLQEYYRQSKGIAVVPADFATKLIERVAALTAEVDALKKGVEAAAFFFESPMSFSNEEFQGVAKQVFKARDGKPCTYTEGVPYLDEFVALKAEVARLSAPVTDAEWNNHLQNHDCTDGIDHDYDVHLEYLERENVNALILARATPPQDVEKRVGFPRDKTDEWEARQDVENGGKQ